MKLIVLIANLMMIAVSAVASPPPFSQFESTTESSTENWDSISESLASKLLALCDKTDREMIADAIKDNGLAKNFNQFFRKAPINLSSQGGRHYFVRPATEPYYPAFYGAHLFRFWVVSEQKQVLLAAAADKFSILPSISNTMHDVMISQCHGGYCYNTTMIYSRGQYRNQSCQKMSIETGEAISPCQ